MIKHITGFRKYIYVCKALQKEFLSLPIPFILFMARQMRFEKFTLHDGKVFINSLYTPFPSKSYTSSLRVFKALSKGRMSVFSAHIALTDRCPMNCWHCSNAGAGKTGDMPFEAASGIIKELQDLGVSCIGFTGGEPALRDDLERLIARVDSRSYPILFTSGYSIDQKRARALKRAGLEVISVSLDSHSKEEHNRKRNNSGAFDSAVSAVRYAREAGIYTAVSVVATKDMLYRDKLDIFIRFAADLDAHEVRVLEPKPCGKLMTAAFEPLDERDRERIRRLQYSVNRNKDLPTVMAFAHINSGKNLGCNAGRTHLYINARQEVCPCDFSPVSFGKLGEEPLAAVYQRMAESLRGPSSVCLNSEIAGYVKKHGLETLPLSYQQVGNDLLRGGEKETIPELFSKLGFKKEWG